MLLLIRFLFLFKLIISQRGSGSAGINTVGVGRSSQPFPEVNQNIRTGQNLGGLFTGTGTNAYYGGMLIFSKIFLYNFKKCYCNLNIKF